MKTLCKFKIALLFCTASILFSLPVSGQSWGKFFPVDSLNQRFGQALAKRTLIYCRADTSWYEIQSEASETDSLYTLVRQSLYKKNGPISSASSGTPVDSIPFYHKTGGTFQRYNDSLVLKQKVRFAGQYADMVVRSTATPVTDNCGVYLYGNTGSLVLNGRFNNFGSFANGSASVTLAPGTGAIAFDYSTDGFGTYGYQLDEWGFYPKDYSTAGDYNQYLGVPTSKWKRAYIDTLNITGPSFIGGKLAVGSSSTPDSTLKVTGGVNVTRGLKVGYDIDVNGIRIGTGKGNNPDNVVIGRYATLSGSMPNGNNVGIGGSVYFNGGNGRNNVSIGDNSMRNATASYSTAIGYNSQNQSTGSYNTSVGAMTIWNTTGYSNTAIGIKSLYSNTTGNNNIALGDSAGYSYTTLSNRMYLGARDSTTTGIFWNRTTGINKGYWNGKLNVKTVPVGARTPEAMLVQDTVTGDVKRLPIPVATTYTATTPVDVSGTVVSIKSDTLTSWRTKQNQGATAYSWGNHANSNYIINPFTKKGQIIYCSDSRLEENYTTLTFTKQRFLYATEDSSLAWMPVTSSQWTTGSADVISYTAGNVGINTTNPSSAKLQIAGKKTVPFAVSTDNDGSLGDSVFYIDAAGRVGIGNTSPGAGSELKVSGSAEASGSYYSTGGNFYLNRNSYGRIGNANNGTNAGFDVYVKAVFAGRWQADGKLGIGTSSPGEKLDVTGEIRCSDTLRVGNYSTYSYVIPGGSWVTSSTAQVKENITEITEPADLFTKVLTVSPKKYNFKASVFRKNYKLTDIPDSAMVDSVFRKLTNKERKDRLKALNAADSTEADKLSKRRMTGFLAEDINAMLGKPDSKEIDYAEIIAILWKTNQALIRKVNDQEARLKKIEQLLNIK